MTTLDDAQTATEVGPICPDCGPDTPSPGARLRPAKAHRPNAGVSVLLIIAAVVLTLVAVAVVAIALHH